jgi:hypothetical protein
MFRCQWRIGCSRMKTQKRFETIDAAKKAVEDGISVFWVNPSYSLKKNKWGEWNIVHVSGFCSPLEDGHKLEDFYA